MPEAVTDRRDHVVHVGDIGGTFARFALARDGLLLSAPTQVERARHPDAASACRTYRPDHGNGLRIDGAAIAGAGRVVGGRIAMTNADWSIDPDALAGELGLRASRVRATVWRRSSSRPCGALKSAALNCAMVSV